MHKLPELEICADLNNWDRHEEYLYSIFRSDFLLSRVVHRGKKVAADIQPMINGKMASFYHLTCKNYDGASVREPDFDRAERIRWPKYILEICKCKTVGCEVCDDYYYWVETVGYPYPRIHILIETERYLVVIEERSGYYRLVTAFYYQYDHALAKAKKRYEKAKNAQN